ncbi:ATP-GRASP peptide maturase, grasp-with-spasm system [Chryseobacterium piscicola]|uniref:ATP-GRASP peptide maturase, grasp-with-spasm system n=1 Tax=Chryseobacterium piscicola TaxID=551459 RepID=A0A1N7KRZ8_9FLAO|nr:grasp-with-spasm system ATP-grasp peptide maturase [Chryseobacterium piscicola]PQA94978.1 grasp-with-spasm system ATP-grasp peptide maturase [Chryseobacterium piscicola]SIS64276.1 ATP-GRASP peptide maturase, grasp-with-spasm system [Chryseobacterium piscicola]
MILIFSISNDYTTTQVCRWIEKLGHDFIRINKDDSCEIEKFDLINDDIIIKINKDTLLSYKDISAVWYRRGGFIHNFRTEKNIDDKEILFQEGNRINRLINDEFRDLALFLQKKFEKNNSIGSYFNSKLNKLMVLDFAKSIGLYIPHTFILAKKLQLKELVDNHKIITKAISDGLYYFAEDYAYYTYTEKISAKELPRFPDMFMPSLFQIQIEKKFEIRSFFLKGKFYSMAIMSQFNDKTMVDYRKYDQKNPNKNIPFKLPTDIQNKLIQIFNHFKLNTGSVDLIVDIHDNYYFLEINPVGQFGMTSRPCNYGLEKIMAEELIKIDIQNESNIKAN